MTTASVNLWGRRIGAVVWLPDNQYAVFEYDPDFIGAGLQVSPIVMPVRAGPISFQSLEYESFRGLPGLLAESLPDDYGNALIDAWLARQGREGDVFNPVERLCYIGTHGMGALEFKPTPRDAEADSNPLQIERLVDFSNKILRNRNNLQGWLKGENDKSAIDEIIRVGTSAGGARAKAVLAWNPKTGEFRSGQVSAVSGFEHWLMKFDGVEGDETDREVGKGQGYGKVEYAYYLMAIDAGINMMQSTLHNESGRSHFMTKRFDRSDDGKKLHYQSLASLAHLDFKKPRVHSYEQAINAMRKLRLNVDEIEQQVRRTIFNIIARNQDDHVKNIGYLMNRAGEWRLSPAFDVTFSYNPDGPWTRMHQMSTNGKFDEFDRADLLEFGRFAGVKQKRLSTIIGEVLDAVCEWPTHALEAGVGLERTKRIGAYHRTHI